MQPLLFPAENLVFKKVKNFYLIFNPDVPNMMVADKMGKDLIQLFNGVRTVSEVLDCLSCRHKLNEKEVRRLEAFISSLVDAAFLCKKLEPVKETGCGLQELTRLFLLLTNKCNLRCIHCHRSSGLQMKNEMQKNKFVRVVGEFANLGGRMLVITGGEPLLRKDTMFEVAKDARDKGIEEIIITSNGTTISNDDIRLFNKYNAKVAISLDGATASTHDLIRGKGTFQSTIKSIERLVKARIDVYTETTLMEPNIDEATKILHTTKNLGVSKVSFSIIMLKGRAEKNRNFLALSNKDVLSVLRTIKKASKRTGVRTNIESFKLGSKKIGKRVLCDAGITMLSIAANGDAYPCQNLHEGLLKAGNVQEQSLKNIWNNSPILKKFREMNVLKIKACRNCELKFICAGGCRADGFSAHADLYGHTPLCSVYREIYWDQLIELAHELWREAQS